MQFQILKLYYELLEPDQIAKLLNVNIEYVVAILQQNGFNSD
jgi:DNA-binding CsgD family transcriptional regulator